MSDYHCGFAAEIPNTFVQFFTILYGNLFFPNKTSFLGIRLSESMVALEAT